MVTVMNESSHTSVQLTPVLQECKIELEKRLSQLNTSGEAGVGKFHLNRTSVKLGQSRIRTLSDFIKYMYTNIKSHRRGCIGSWLLVS